MSSFRIIENKHDVYRGKYCMKKFCESLREHAMMIINFNKKKMKLLRICYICEEKFESKDLKDKKEIIVIIQRNIEVLRTAYVI